MRDRIFFDTNILVYSFSVTEPEKAEKALSFLDDCIPVVSAQVLNEFTNVMVKSGHSLERVKLEVKNIVAVCEVVDLTKELTFDAIERKDKFSYSYYDSLIIAAALESGCAKLYTEDMQNGQIINHRLKLVNPFLSGEST
jgi:predicted nucleic acid-binding protein